MPDFANDNQQPARDAPTGRPCPICGKGGVHAYRPFCSRRCADVDLARWLGGSYAIPANPSDDEEEHVEIPSSHGDAS